jgi:hypothetical protein
LILDGSKTDTRYERYSYYASLTSSTFLLYQYDILFLGVFMLLLVNECTPVIVLDNCWFKTVYNKVNKEYVIALVSKRIGLLYSIK